LTVISKPCVHPNSRQIILTVPHRQLGSILMDREDWLQKQVLHITNNLGSFYSMTFSN